jgi:hypothetical protein
MCEKKTPIFEICRRASGATGDEVVCSGRPPSWKQLPGDG